MEMIDILNSDGSATGQKTYKKDAHEKGLWHRAAHIWFINSKKEILLQKRADNMETYPGQYDISAAGHLSAGDTSMAGALREVKEELGITLIEKDLIKIGEIKQEKTHRGGTYIDKEYNDIYVVHKDIPISDFVVQESEVSLVKYISLEEFRKWVKEERKELTPRPEEFKMLLEYLEGVK